MNNKNIDTAIKAYLEGNRNEEFISVIAEWIKDNPQNARTFADIQDIVASYKMRDRFSSENIEKAYKKIERKISGSKNDDNNIQSIKKSSRPYHKIFRYVACIAVIALIGSITFFILNITNNSKLLVARTANEVSIINLSDGSVVWLNRNSELHYPKRFKGPERNVSLTGEAYFEVGANKDFPFVVSSNGMDVKAIGTAFNFNTELANNIEEIALLDGSVFVEGKKNEGKIMIVPYQKVILDKTNHRMTVEQMHSGIEAYWHNHLAPLNNATMRDIARVFESLYGVSITLIGDNNYKSTYSGFISQDESIEKALEALSYSIPFTYSISGSNVTITMKK